MFVMRWKMPDAPRAYKMLGYPIVRWIFILFALTFLSFTVYNDFVAYRIAIAAGKSALLNSIFDVVSVGTSIYFYRRAGKFNRSNAQS